MPKLRLFAQAREAAGTAADEFPGGDVGSVLDAAVASYGEGFEAVLERSTVWLNGEQTEREATVGSNDEVAVLPPISGGTADA